MADEPTNDLALPPQRHSHARSHQLQDSPRHVHFQRSTTPRSHSSSPRSTNAMTPPESNTMDSVDLGKAQDGANEASPLLTPSDDDQLTLVPPMPTDTTSSPIRPNFSSGRDEGEEEPRSSSFLFFLTLSMLGLQIGWSVELSQGSPYLLSLGISKSLLAFVWIAGPLSGTLVQPYIGIRSDRCRSRFGKRRPFMLGGTLATVASLLVLAWTKEIVSTLFGLVGVAEDSEGVRIATIVLAVLMIYVLDFAINVVQAAIRAFIVDSAPGHQQDSANAWASRMAGLGNIVGYLLGFVNLSRWLPFFGDTQFKVLCVLGCWTMFITIGASCLAIQEEDARLDRRPRHHEVGIMAFFKTLYKSVHGLSPQIRRVCEVQFFAWIGWFPFLFYTTTYVAEIYSEPYYAAQPEMTPAQIEYFWQQGTRAGTFALFMFAVVTFITSVLLPFAVAKNKAPIPALATSMADDAERLSQASTPTAHAVVATSTTTIGDYFAQRPASQANHSTSPTEPFTTRIRKGGLLSLRSLEVQWLTLRRTWLLSHLVFTALTWSTLFVRTVIGATVLVSLIGIPWAITQWAPFAMIAAEIRKRESMRRNFDTDTEDGADVDAKQAGVVLGIHNVAIAAPQVLATLVSSAIFRALQKPRGSVGDDSVAWVLRFGGLAALVAAWLTRRVQDGRRVEQGR